MKVWMEGSGYLDVVLESVGDQGLAEEGGHTGEHARPWVDYSTQQTQMRFYNLQFLMENKTTFFFTF